MTATLSIDANGSNPTVDITIPGHSATALVIKEVSTEMIALYTGVSPAEGAVSAEFSVFVTYGLPGGDKIFGGAEDENFEYGIDPINFTNTVTWGALTEGGLKITGIDAVFVGALYLHITFDRWVDDVIYGNVDVYTDAALTNLVDTDTWKTTRKN